MSEIIIALFLTLVALVLSASMGRGLYAPASGALWDRVLSAAERATKQLLWRQGQLLSTLLAIAIVVLGAGAFHARAHLVSQGWSALLLLCSLLLGAACVLWSVAQATSWATASVRHALSLPLADVSPTSSLRAATVGATRAESSALLLTLALIGAAHLSEGASSLGPQAPLQAAANLLSASALGALCATVVLQLGGGTIQAAAGVASRAAAKLNPELDRQATHNPTLVAELVGDLSGVTTAQTADAVASQLLANAATLTLALTIAESNTGLNALAVASAPLLLRALGLATVLCLRNAQARGNTTEPVWTYRATYAVQLIACGSALYWVVGERWFLVCAGCCVLGLSPMLLPLLLPHKLAPQSSQGDPLDAQTARALGGALQGTLVPLLTTGASLSAAFLVGTKSGMPGGADLALLLAVAGMTMSAMLYLSGNLSISIESTRRRLGEVTRQTATGTQPRHWVEPNHVHQRPLVVVSCASALLGILALPQMMEHLGGAAEPISRVGLLLGGLVGAVLLAAYVGAALSTASWTASQVGTDILNFLQSPPRDARQRGYAASLQMATDTALRAAVPVALGGAVGPLILAGLALSIGEHPWPGVEASVLACSGVAALGGTAVALAAIGASSLLQPAGLGRDEGLQRGPSSGHFLSHSVAPAAQVLLKSPIICFMATVPLSL